MTETAKMSEVIDCSIAVYNDRLENIRRTLGNVNGPVLSAICGTQMALITEFIEELSKLKKSSEYIE